MCFSVKVVIAGYFPALHLVSVYLILIGFDWEKIILKNGTCQKLEVNFLFFYRILLNQKFSLVYDSFLLVF